ncbi:WD40 repeat-like protein [Mycena belliarum]|uniref:WD40 repeat-like protein n=1 Tax=Mycena belliarum TaxID=1033014 RepID=A0AAD6UB32_9AGAR|nr:WD40 repeat-like protein [Mycena belliae]
MAAPNATRNARTHKRLLSRRWAALNFDRVNVLGDDASYGHSGCVNALSWARDGELLLTGGDDRTVQIWRMDSTLLNADYPFVCRSVIQTGHLANIFNAKWLPYSHNIATVAGDGQVRVHQVGQIGNSGPPATAQLSSRDTCIHRLRCHEGRVKRIELEDSPHLFLTAAEDGTVRQHDLRTSHSCSDYGSCPPPLLRLNFELSTLSASPLTPFQLVVAGESAYGYLFDRRQAGRFLLAEKGLVENGMTHCIRRFGRSASSLDTDCREHITGSRMSSQNGHEVLLSYSADAVYIFSTKDDPEEADSMESSRPLSSNTRSDLKHKPTNMLGDESSSTIDDDMDIDIDNYASEEEEDQEQEDLASRWASRDAYSKVPLILPRTRFSGARNVDTIKDVNFLGPDDEYVASGSDDGNFFIWRKDGALHGIFEGDGSVVNVIEPHPHLPLFATSGIDTTVKLFAPVSGPSSFSQLDSAERIMAANQRQSIGFRRLRLRRHDFTSLLAAVTSDEHAQTCNHQ